MYSRKKVIKGKQMKDMDNQKEEQVIQAEVERVSFHSVSSFQVNGISGRIGKIIHLQNKTPVFRAMEHHSFDAQELRLIADKLDSLKEEEEK